jgi:prevent-host-death family protein
MQYSVVEAGRCLPELIRSARAGEEVLIAEGGEPVARLVPASQPAAPSAGLGANVLAWLAEHPLPPEACRSADEIDAAIEAERTAWE